MTCKEPEALISAIRPAIHPGHGTCKKLNVSSFKKNKYARFSPEINSLICNEAIAKY